MPSNLGTQYFRRERIKKLALFRREKTQGWLGGIVHRAQKVSPGGPKWHRT
jgi:hypothetical protein